MGTTRLGMLLAALLFVGMLILLEVGRRAGVRRQLRDPSGTGAGALEAAVFGLLALLIAFTFSGAASRFDARRHLVVEEANAIGTAYLRVDLLPPAVQPASGTASAGTWTRASTCTARFLISRRRGRSSRSR
jgi:hypothetical protein